jgi:CDP-diacylglycerol--glycerol-3-phosphate 3-phosphatidyltransferase
LKGLSTGGRRLVAKIFNPIAVLLGRLKVSPNFFTVLGFLFSLAAGISFALAAELPALTFYSAGFFIRLGGGLILLSGLCDIFDGAVARASGKESAFGAFLDSVLDRYSETAALTGLIYYFAVSGSITYTIVTVLVLGGSVFVSYAKARAEGLGVECRVGIMERPERLILLIIGALGAGYILLASLWLLALLSHITAIQRILHTRKILRQSQGRPVPPVLTATASKGNPGKKKIHAQ